MNAPSTPQTPTPGREVVSAGRPPFEPTAEHRQRVLQYAKAFPIEGERHIAILLGIGLHTLRKYFAHELALGRAQMIATIGAQMINRAIDAEAKDASGNLLAKGDIDAAKFVLARLGGWTTKIQHSDATTPAEAFDASRLTPEERQALRPLLEKALGAPDAPEGQTIDVQAEESDGDS